MYRKKSDRVQTVPRRERQSEGASRNEGVPISKDQLERIDALLYDTDSLARSLTAAERREYREAEESITAARRHAERSTGFLKLY